MVKEYNTLLFSGGGFKGCAYVGVFKKLEEIIQERKIAESLPDFNKDTCKIPIININTVCAVSVGTIFSLIFLMGYSFIEMLEEVLTKKFDTLKNIKIMNFVNKYGLDSGDLLMKWIESLMIRKNVDINITLYDFFEKTKVDFQIIATNLNKYCYKKFNYIDTPNVKVLDAIRMSISIPFIFTTNKFEGDYYVDGGISENYSIRMFENNLDNVLGFKLINNGEMDTHVVNEEINDIESFIYHVLSCYVVQKEKHTTRSELFKKCTVYIHTEQIYSSLNFSLTPIEKNNLINIGYKATDDFFKNEM